MRPLLIIYNSIREESSSIEQTVFMHTPNMSTFQDTVCAVVKKIPMGKMMTYKEVARRSGSPRAYRAVGNIMKRNTDPAIPCHRVIKSDGTPGGYNGLAGKKLELLRGEGAKPPRR